MPYRHRVFATFPRAALDGSIPARFHDQATRHAARVAVQFDGCDITYAELHGRVLAAAAALRAATPAKPSAVAIVVPQGVEQIVAILAVLEAGHWYVPFDPAAGRDELAVAFERAEIAAVFTARATLAAADDAARGRRPVLRIDDLAGSGDAPTPPSPACADHLAYVYFTSGTTGAPKGVMDTHRNVMHNVARYTDTLAITPDDRLTLIQTCTFSGAVSNVFGALLNGATLLPYDVARDGLGERFRRWLADARPTIYHSVPTIFRRACVAGARFPSVRVVRIEGDGAVPADVEAFFAHFGAAGGPGGSDAVLVHGLGTTETGLCRQFFVRRGDAVPRPRVPIGYPVEGTEVRVVDDRLAPVAAGEVGEIVVRGRHLALGYWRDEARTAAAFRAVPGAPGLREYRTGDLGRLGADGCLEHLGRRDHQVRVRGMWVDGAEVEAALLRQGGVREALVVAEHDAQQETVLAAYLVTAPGAMPTARELRQALAATLAAHAVPRRFLAVDQLPLGPHGKVDRRAPPREGARELPSETPAAPARRPPRDAVEAELAAIWRQVLGHADFGVDDAFFDVGGDSLAATDVVVAIEQRLHASVPPSALLAAGTIAALARCIADPGAAPAPPSVLVLNAAGRAPPLFCVDDLTLDPQLFAPLARRLGTDQPVFALRPPYGRRRADVPRTIEALARRHIEAIRAVAPAGPYRLLGLCFGAVVALEMARLLHEEGHGVAQLALVNVTPYDLPALVPRRTRLRFRLDLAARVRYVAAKAAPRAWLAAWLRERLHDHTWRWRAAWQRRVRPDAIAADDFVRATLHAAFGRHRATPHDGDVTLVLADESLPLYTDEPQQAWVGLTRGRLTLHRLPHDGHAMLHEPAVAQLAQWLAEGLAAHATPRRSQP
jgi:amino acid adenylation domain-containing protein